MSYKARVVGAAQEVLKCRVKDISGPNTKIVALPLETYARLRKEMKIEILTVMQKGDRETYAKLKLRLPSENGIPMDESATQAPAPTPEPAAPPAPPVEAADIPEPPVNNKQRLPDEEDHDFRVRRMKEGKAYKAWEREYGAAYKAAQEAPPVPPQPEISDEPPVKERVPQGFDPSLNPPPGPAGEAFDPMKEQIESEAMEALLNKHQ